MYYRLFWHIFGENFIAQIYYLMHFDILILKLSREITGSSIYPLSNIHNCDSKMNLAIVSELTRQSNLEILLMILDRKNLSFFVNHNHLK